MRVLLLFGILALALARAGAQQDAPPDPALLQRFIDADPGAARRQLAAEVPAVMDPRFRTRLSEIALAHTKQGRTLEAIREYEAVLELCDMAASRPCRVAALVSLASVYGRNGEYGESVKLLQASLDLADPVADEALIANAANNLGNVYRRRGEMDKALDAYQRALASNEAARRDVPTARTLNNIGIVYVTQGDFRRGTEYYLRSLELKERVGPKDEISSTLGNIGALFVLQGNHPQAIEYLERALALAEKENDVRMVVGTLGDLGRVYLESDRPAQAEAPLMRARALAEKAGAKDLLGGLLVSLGNLELQRGQWARAGEYASRAHALFTEMGDPFWVGQALMSLSRIELARGRPQLAVGFAEQARASLMSIGTPTALIDAEVLYGNALTDLKRWDDAIATFERAIGLTERGLELVSGDAEDRHRYLESSSSSYVGLAHATAAAGRAADALLAAERGRARTLLDMLTASRPDDDELSEAERERRIEIDTALNSLNERVATDRARTGTGRAVNPSLMAELERLRKSRDEYYLGLDAKHPRLRFARGATPVLTAAEVAATLPARSALVEFVVGPRGVWTLVLAPRANGAAPQLIVKAATLPAERVTALAATFTRQVSTRDLAFAANARALYDALLGPVDAALTGVDHLIVVPHAGLWDVPFQALQTPRGRYLIEEHAIAYAPSASTLKELAARRKTRPAQPRVVAFGDPRTANAKATALPHAAREAREVARIYGADRAVVAVEADATEGRFRQVAPRADIVHIATHGVLDNASPLFSYLTLAGSGSQKATDGRLEGHELINMQLDAELVVLSACETARGRIGNGEGVVGLSWALFAAGASTAAVSLWPVDSASTTDLMSAFHRERRKLTAGSAPAPNAQALRASQVAALARPESRHPFYWAGFVVIGVP